MSYISGIFYVAYYFEHVITYFRLEGALVTLALNTDYPELIDHDFDIGPEELMQSDYADLSADTWDFQASNVSKIFVHKNSM